MQGLFTGIAKHVIYAPHQHGNYFELIEQCLWGQSNLSSLFVCEPPPDIGVSSIESSVTPSASTMPATAADVPIELYDLILSFYEPRTSDDYHDVQYVPIQKHKLGAKALVCRNWALKCQPKLFDDIELRSLDDAEQLITFMNHPTSRVHRYLKTISYRLVDISPGIPWIHIACRKLRHSKRLPSSVKFLLNAPLCHMIKAKDFLAAISSPFPTSNRIMCIGSLHLATVEFSRFGDLVRAVRQLPCLNMAEFRRVKWAEHEDFRDGQTLMIPYLPPLIAPICIYSMEDCTDDWAAIWLACSRSSTKSRQLLKGDVEALHRIMSCVVRCQSMPEPVRSWIEDDKICWYLSHPGSGLHIDVFIVDFDMYHWKLKATLTSTGKSTVHREVQRLQFDLHRRRSYESVDSGTDWTTIDEQLATLQALDQVNFRFTSSQDMFPFAEETIASHMPRLYLSNKLQFTMVSGAGSDLEARDQTENVQQGTSESCSSYDYRHDKQVTRLRSSVKQTEITLTVERHKDRRRSAGSRKHLNRIRGHNRD
ncbi:hypothetical protein NM688_g8961 [Phlebia brevispora]|uniref:Uncharacterized protein n=1 Tax=Phlebia brevispora TaxID=194682 RepID=A0ACC1RPM8_9APHY|nr:hypothetical protein NM688_g8961 [Phlebia brevispora]